VAQGFCLSQQAPRYGPHWRDISDRQAPAGGLDSGVRFSGGITSAAWTGGHPPCGRRTSGWEWSPLTASRSAGCWSPQPRACSAPAPAQRRGL